MPLNPPAAATIPVRQTLDLLDGPFAAVAAGVAEDRYAFWLGSGISFGRVDGLKQVIPRVIEFLRMQIAAGTSDCRFQKALNEALDLAQLSADEKARVDFTQSFTDWPDAQAIVGRIISSYAKLLDIMIDREDDDYLLWEGVNIESTFANPTKKPDVEHLCLAILVLEGVASDIATANWDGLIEQAAETLTGGHQAIVVCVRPEELREPRLRARLFKFHGCAVRAVSDEGKYRHFLIGRHSQIHGWAERPENAPMVNRLIDLIVTKPTLMMGLSAQDANIQTLFAKAEASMAWEWPGDGPGYVFSEDALGFDQKGLLKNVYRAAWTSETRQQILENSLIRAYAKPLLIALVLHVLCSKLRKLIELASERLDASDRQQLQDGVITLRNTLAAHAEPDHLNFVHTLIEHSGRAIGMFRDGHVPEPPRPYAPITPIPIQQMPGDPTIPASGLREAAVAIGVGAGQEAWVIEEGDGNDPKEGVIRVRSPASSAKLFFAANSHTTLCLQYNGHLAEDDDEAVVIYSSQIQPPMYRSPRGAPGRTGRVGLREVSIAELLTEARNSNELIQRFREEIAI